MSPTHADLTPSQLIAAANTLPRFPLAQLPTPLEPLHRFSKVMGGPQIYIKRDDCTGLALGGNKTRHNEFLIGRAVADGADIVVWGAGVQSNNCRQTAAACAKAGLDCHLILGRGGPAGAPEVVQGNLLLDHLVGAIIDIVDEKIGPELDARIAAKADEYRRAGRKVYYWDGDSVKVLASVSYAICYAEIIEQTQQLGFLPDAIYLSSAGSTGAGMVLGREALGQQVPIRNIAPLEWPWDTAASMAELATRAGQEMGLPVEVPREAVDVTFDYIPPGYGKCSPGGLEAIALLARTEGILVDPIYSGKALAGLIDDIRRGRYASDDKVVFVHTGGTPALFAYHEELVRGIAPRRE